MSPPVAHWKNLSWMRLLQFMFKILIGKPEDACEIILKWTPIVCRQHYFGRSRDTRWSSWLRHCAISREFVVSIPDGVTGISHLHNPSGGTTALVSTQPLREISTRNISWGQRRPVRRAGFITLMSDCLEIWQPQPPGTLLAWPRLYRNCCTFTYSLLTPWCRVLLEKLTGLQLVKKFPAFYGTRRFITALTSARHLSLSWASPIHSTYPHPTSWRSILMLSTHLRLGLPSGLFPSGSPTKTLYTPLSLPIRATCPAHLILLDFITRTILGEEYKSFSSWLCSLLHSPVTSSLLGPNILNTVFRDTLH